MNRLIMVSNRLPVRIEADGSTSRMSGGLASALEGADLTGVEQVWVGWTGGAVEDFENLDAVETGLEETGVWPVFLSADEIDGFYEGYSNSSLWPVLHYMTERAKFSEAWWEVYRKVNERFAQTILERAEVGDMVWIHDYHLLLVPSLLRGHDKGLRVGFFLHTPFCSSEIFRVIPERVPLLRGLLGADVLGFHTYSYLRHFRSSLLRVLGLESEAEGIWHDGREIHFGVYPIGHNHVGFEAAMKAPSFSDTVAKHRDELGGQRLILSVERLDYTKGLPEKLAAIRRFLERCPAMRDEVTFVLIAVPTRQGVEEYDQLTEQVQREVGAINGKYGGVGHAPVQFIHRGLPTEDLAALYALSEVCLVTPLRDGMNLVAKEFLDCQTESIAGRPGVLILSEFAGAAEVLSDAIQVNPHDVGAVAEALERALNMPDDERRQRIRVMQAHLRDKDSGAWAGLFVGDLSKVPESEQRAAVVQLKPLAKQLAERRSEGETIGLFLDYDGTLRGFVDVPDEAVPDPALPGLLRDLAASERVMVAVMSGRKPDFLERHLGGLGVTLVAEHGYTWLEGGTGEWQLFNPHVDIDWKEGIRERLEQAALVTPGTHVEEKQSALVWHYRKAEPEFGLWRARGLLDELTELAANLPVSVHHGQKIVEVSSLQVSKGVVVDHLVQKWTCDVAFAAGDDQTDETMFAQELEGIEYYPVKVGKGSTRAVYRTDITGLRNFLETLRGEFIAAAG